MRCCTRKDRTARHGEVRMVQEIEDLPAEYKTGLLPEFCPLDDSRVDVALAKSP